MTPAARRLAALLTLRRDRGSGRGAARRVGDLLGEADCIQRLGDIDLRRSDHGAARARYEEALPLYRRVVGSLLGEANCILSLGDIDLAAGAEETARGAFAAALALCARIPEPYSMGRAHQRLARIALGDPDRQAHHLEAARAAWRAIQRRDLIADLDREFPPGDG